MAHDLTTRAWALGDRERAAPQGLARGDRGQGLLLVGHGSRETAGVAEFQATARLVAASAGSMRVQSCFLEFAEPTIAQGIESLAERGVERMIVAPALLFRAGHAERDIPHAVAKAAQAHPRLRVDWAEHLGCHQTIVELSAARYLETLSGEATVPDERTALLMVGRGSHSAAATAEMIEFVELRHRRTPVADAQACFVSIAAPKLEAALEQAAQSGARRIVVQPHFLFAGALVGRIHRTVARYREQFGHLQWLTTEHLGPSDLLARCILDRALAAGPQPR